MTAQSNAFFSALIALPLVCAFASQASAGGYVGIGIGAESGLEGEMADHFSTNAQSDSSRIILGQRFGALALEASLFGSELQGNSNFTGNSDFSTVSLGVDVKYYLGLIGGLEGYGKLGVNKTWLTGPATEDMNYEGRGREIGVGLQYTINLPLTQVGLWLDYTVQSTSLQDIDSSAGVSLGGQLKMMNLGVSVGF